MQDGSSRLGWVIAATTATLVVAGLTILVLNLDHPPEGGWGFRGFPVIFAAGAGPLGWLIMRRRPDNRVGLLLAFIGLLNAGQLFLTEYASAGTRGSLPASNVAALVNAFIWVPTLGLMTGGVALLFPDGRLPSKRWRPVAWTLVASAGALCLIIAAYPSAIDTPRLVRRDFRLPIDDPTLNAASYVALAVFALAIVGSAASLFRRWRRSTGVVREQLKWLALSLGLVIATMWVSIIPGQLAAAIFITAIGTMPVAVGIAVLRYRLYEIDAVINRTVVYGALTAILTGAFAALQKGLQAVFVSATGNESDAATIITTLVLATSFVPLKKALETVAARRLGGPRDHPAPVDPGLVGAGDPNSSTRFMVDSADLEALLRRVVREELEAAREDAR